LITEETAELYATRKGKVSQAIDAAKKARGIATSTESGLRLDIPIARRPASPSVATKA
jgi:hypothetical protein